ncbi:hypothetical protein PIIN_04978 [Serendipita indica DSM 11827]|uniref:Uncharacterized protein n=1 Tax=Serendipita indica (strain DSM 11827) TaxID=1109443 RepID=G4TIA0_SERID|nr:hypothetical protein PIIN_04978 [Serendipita indica DSM 11827]
MSVELKDGDEYSHRPTATQPAVAHDQANEAKEDTARVQKEPTENGETQEASSGLSEENMNIQHPEVVEQRVADAEGKVVDRDKPEKENKNRMPAAIDGLTTNHSDEDTSDSQPAMLEAQSAEVAEEPSAPLTTQVVRPQSPAKEEESDTLGERFHMGLNTSIDESIEAPNHSDGVIALVGGSQLESPSRESEKLLHEVETESTEDKILEENELINTRLALGLEHPPHIELPAEVLERSPSIIPIPPSTSESLEDLREVSDGVQEWDDSTPTKEQGDPLQTVGSGISSADIPLNERELPAEEDEASMLNARLELGLEPPVHAHIPADSLEKSASVITIPASTPRIDDFVSEDTTPELETSEPGNSRETVPLTEESLQIQDQDSEEMFETRLEIGLDYPVQIDTSNKEFDPTVSNVTIPPSTPHNLDDIQPDLEFQDQVPLSQPDIATPPLPDVSAPIKELKEENLPIEDDEEALLERRLELAIGSPEGVVESITLPTVTESAVTLPSSTPPAEVSESNFAAVQESSRRVLSTSLPEDEADVDAASLCEQTPATDEDGNLIEDITPQVRSEAPKGTFTHIPSLEGATLVPLQSLDDQELEPQADPKGIKSQTSLSSYDISGHTVSLEETNLPAEDTEQELLARRLELGPSAPVGAEVVSVPLEKTARVTALPPTPQAIEVISEGTGVTSAGEEREAIHQTYVTQAGYSGDHSGQKLPQTPEEILTPPGDPLPSHQDRINEDSGSPVRPSLNAPGSDAVAESTATVKPSARPEVDNEVDRPVIRVVGFEGDTVETSGRPASPLPLGQTSREAFVFDTPDGSDHYQGFPPANITTSEHVDTTAPEITVLQVEDSPPPRIVSSVPKDGITQLIPVRIHNSDSDTQLRPEAQRMLSTTPEAPTSPRSETFDETDEYKQQNIPIVRPKEVEPPLPDTPGPQIPSVNLEVPLVEVTSSKDERMGFVDDARSERSVATSVAPIAPNSPRFISPIPTPSLDSTQFMLGESGLSQTGISDTNRKTSLMEDPVQMQRETEDPIAELAPNLKDALNSSIEPNTTFKLDMQPQLAPVAEDGMVDANATVSSRPARPRHTSSPSTWSVNRSSGWFQSGSHAKDAGRPSLEIASGEFSRPLRSAPPEYPPEVGVGSKGKDDGRCVIF